MADGSLVALAITTASSLALGGGALIRSMRQDNRQADQTRTDTAVAALERNVASLERQLQARIDAELQLRRELETERRERAASELRLNTALATLTEKYEHCEAERLALERRLNGTAT